MFSSRLMPPNDIQSKPGPDCTEIEADPAKLPTDTDHAMLRAIKQPALVISGGNDAMLPAANAYMMFKAMSNAQLVLYPDSGHGALFQHHEAFVSHVQTFLDA
jgi:pimeloyl-ACP methyl ester carboxylesterase